VERFGVVLADDMIHRRPRLAIWTHSARVHPCRVALSALGKRHTAHCALAGGSKLAEFGWCCCKSPFALLSDTQPHARQPGELAAKSSLGPLTAKRPPPSLSPFPSLR